jgi:formylmethanofuran dehydrogenase subunit E
MEQQRHERKKGGKIMIAESVIQKVKEFHGHSCPGLAIGIRVAELALKEVGPHAADEEVVAVVETDMCAVDAIQYLTGCTFGKGNLIHLDYGKNAFTFYRRSDGHGVRIVVKPGVMGPETPERKALLKGLSSGTLSAEERDRFTKIQAERRDRIMGMPLEDLFEVKPAEKAAPRRARILESLVCEACGEGTMESRTRKLNGKTLCIPCFEQSDRRL